MSIVAQESQGDTDAVRYEPKSSLIYTPSIYAKKLNITFDTEMTLQHMSYGLCQVMGFKAREMGFDGPLFHLTQPEIGLEYGCRALAGFTKKYVYPEDAIASFNAGSPRYNNGKYINQAYVDEVKLKWAAVEKLKVYT